MAAKCVVAWPATVTGTVDASDINDRAAHLVLTEMIGTGKKVWWTDDFTSTGTSLFSATSAPMVVVCALARGGGWTQNVIGGQMYIPESRAEDAFAVNPTWDSGASRWMTELWRWNAPGTGELESNDSQGRRQFVLHAIGKGP